MPDDDREDTATGIGPSAGSHPSMEEELPTSITTSPITPVDDPSLEDGPTGVVRSPIDAAEPPTKARPAAGVPASEPPEPPSDDGPTGIAKSPSRPDTSAAAPEHSPADDDGPTSISRVALDDDWESGVPTNGSPPAAEHDETEDGPTGVTKVDLPPPDEVPTGRTARPAGIVAQGAARKAAEAPAPAPAEGAQLPPDPEEDSVVTLQKPLTDVSDVLEPAKASASKLPVAIVPPRPKASDIYDVDDDKTERRDLPSEEINRAIARVKLEHVAISELPDESPTARRADLAITPRAGVRSAAAAQPDEPPELSTETDLGPLVRRTLNENAMRPPFTSESDNAITEPAIEKEARLPRTTNLMSTAAVLRATQQIVPAPPPRPPENSLGTDSFTFQGGAGELQAVIPMTTSVARASSGPATPASSALMRSAAGAPSTQSMQVQPLPAGYSQPPHTPSSTPHLQMAATLQSAAMLPTAPASFPPGLPPGALNGTIQPASGPPSGHMQIGGSFPPPLGSASNGSGLVGTGGVARAPSEEPRWIVLVLGVLAVCILIPTVLYLVLRSRADDALPEETPVRAVVTVQTAQPKDVGKKVR